ncbi:MAG: hypothetical protein ACTSQY_00620 [Candidatus Odinarchaeia archaeon]|nr:MAG: hypothetical protein [Lokiarchaeota virus Fenrir Meg22_1012]URC17302.1 MAG: hypothetical protein [Lokiarchaeota virus Fenrir Meg22_1214]
MKTKFRIKDGKGKEVYQILAKIGEEHINYYYELRDQGYSPSSVMGWFWFEDNSISYTTASGKGLYTISANGILVFKGYRNSFAAGTEYFRILEKDSQFKLEIFGYGEFDLEFEEACSSTPERGLEYFPSIQFKKSNGD